MTKYPRTPHLPWSSGTPDDESGQSELVFRADTVMTQKMDGENTTLYRDGLHARSLSMGNHPSRDRIKQLHALVAPNIPEGWRVCGENLTAKHSIFYEDLPNIFMIFSIWDERNLALSWDETVEWAALLELPTVPVIARFGPGHPEVRFTKAAHDKWLKTADLTKVEGYVVRVARSFGYLEFSDALGKFVRPNHVQTSEHWKDEAIIYNKLKEP